MAIKDYLLSEVPGNKLQVGDTFPEFELYGNDFEKHNSKELLGKKKLVIFYPSLETSICDIQLNNVATQLGQKNISVVGISNDSVITCSKWCSAKNHQNVLALSLHNNNFELVKKLGLYLPVCDFLCYRAAYALDEKNKILGIAYAPKLKAEIDIANLVQLL